MCYNKIVESWTNYFMQSSQIDREYTRICSEILLCGTTVKGRDDLVYKQKFGQAIRLDLRKGFPALTLRRLPVRNLFREFMWDLTGGDNVNDLGRAKHFWSFLADAHGRLPASYGQSWRNWPNPEMLEGQEWQPHKRPNSPFDQLLWIDDTLKTCPTNRRLILQTYNPSLNPRIPPCHSEVIFSSDGVYLDTMVVARSNDAAFGIPLDIFRYATMQVLLGLRAELIPRHFLMASSNNHIYSINEQDIATMIAKHSCGPCELRIHNYNRRFEDLDPEKDFELVGYNPHEAIKLKFAG